MYFELISFYDRQDMFFSKLTELYSKNAYDPETSIPTLPTPEINKQEPVTDNAADSTPTDTPEEPTEKPEEPTEKPDEPVENPEQAPEEQKPEDTPAPDQPETNTETNPEQPTDVPEDSTEAQEPLL